MKTYNIKIEYKEEIEIDANSKKDVQQQIQDYIMNNFDDVDWDIKIKELK